MWEKTCSDSPDITAMRLGVDYHGFITIRGWKIKVRPLSLMENNLIAQTVYEQFQRLPPSAQTSLSEHTLLAKETIKLATTSDVGATDFQLTDYILDRMTPEEVQFLHKQYVSIIDKCNPSIEEMGLEDLKKLIEDVKKNPLGVELDLALTALSFYQLVNLCRHLLTQKD